jgi:hypothetical protein
MDQEWHKHYRSDKNILYDAANNFG